MKNKLIKTSLLIVLAVFTLNNVTSVSAAKHKNSSVKTTKIKKTKTKKSKSKQTTSKLTGLPLDNNSSMISNGNEIKLTQNTKVNYVDIAKGKVVKTKTVKAGTTL